MEQNVIQFPSVKIKAGGYKGYVLATLLHLFFVCRLQNGTEPFPPVRIIANSHYIGRGGRDY